MKLLPRALLGLAVFPACAGAVLAAETGPSLLDFSEREVKQILSHGPWPVLWTPDPSNRVSGKPEAAELGRRLFFDKRLSTDATVACATCHDPARGWTDGRHRGRGHDAVDRNTQSLLNVRLNRWFGWGGSSDSLWAHSLRPIVDKREMGASAEHIAQTLSRDRNLARLYARVFKTRAARQEPEEVLVNAAKALAAFQETIVSGRTPFDEFRDALAAGDRAATSRYPIAAQRGLRTFIGKGSCTLCHTGPAFTNGEFHDIGVPFFKGPGAVDGGRHEGIKELLASPYNLLSRFNDDPTATTAWKTRHVDLQHRNFGEFRVPSLRNLGLTAPYIHNGLLPSLRTVISHYSELEEERLHAHGERILKPLDLTPGEVSDLVAFLDTLNEQPAARAPPASQAKQKSR